MKVYWIFRERCGSLNITHQVSVKFGDPSTQWSFITFSCVRWYSCCICVFSTFLWVCDFVFSTKSNQFSSWFNWLDDELGLSLSTFSPEIFTATLVEVILLSSAVSRYYLKFCLFVLFFAISEVHQPVQITKLLQDKSSKVSINFFLCSTCASQKVFVRTVN